MIGSDARRGASPRMKNSRVVTPTEAPADRKQRFAGELASEIHRHLTGPSDTCAACGGDELLDGDAEVGTCGRLDVGDRVLTLRVPVCAARIELLEHLA